MIMEIDKAGGLVLKMITLNDDGRYYKLEENGNTIGRYSSITNAHDEFIRAGRKRGVLVVGETPAGLYSQ